MDLSEAPVLQFDVHWNEKAFKHKHGLTRNLLRPSFYIAKILPIGFEEQFSREVALVDKARTQESWCHCPKEKSTKAIDDFIVSSSSE